MKTQPNYTLVGLFVVSLISMMIIGGIWLTYGLQVKHYQNYLVYLNESVAGLTVKAPVKYMGVDIGIVKNISLRPDNPQQVSILLALEKSTPINSSTTATLNTQGLTGIAYLELKSREPAAPPLTIQGDEPYPVIAAAPSLMFRLDTALDHLSTNINKISQGLNRVLDKKNNDALHKILLNVARFSRVLLKNSDQIDTFIKNISEISTHFDSSLTKAEQTITGIQKTTDTANKVLQTSQFALTTLNEHTLPDFSLLLRDFYPLLTTFNTYMKQLNADPAILIYGRKPLPLGPGEKS